MRTAFVASGSILAFASAMALIGTSAGAATTVMAVGQKVYERECASCHQIGPGAMSLSTGPALNGIIGMPAADEPGFAYSDANEKCGIIWTSASFDAFIADPQAVMPGTAMAYAGLKVKADRDVLFAYVNSFGAQGEAR